MRKGGQLFRRTNPNAAQQQQLDDELRICAIHRVQDVAKTIRKIAADTRMQARQVARDVNVGDHELRTYITQLEMTLGRIAQDATGIVNCKQPRVLQDTGGRVTFVPSGPPKARAWWKFW